MPRFILVLLTIVWSAFPLFADAISDRVIENLRVEGFKIVQMDHTWLGRIWILAQNASTRREIVFIPSTGEILRDYSVSLASLAPEERNGSGTAPDMAADINNNIELVEDPAVTPQVAADVPMTNVPVASGFEITVPQ
jgi:hypothetical protein